MVAPAAPVRNALDQLPITDAVLMQLATECARNIYPLPDICRLFSIDVEYFEAHIRKHPRFMVFYAEAHALWNSSTNTRERSALKSAHLFEKWLDDCNKLFMSANEPLSSKVALMQLLGKVGKVIEEKKEGGVAPGDRVVVNINLGAGRMVTIDKVAPPLDVTPEGTVLEPPK